MESLSKYLPNQFELLQVKKKEADYVECIVRHKIDNVNLFLKLISFEDVQSHVSRRQLLSQLRRNVDFLNELDHPNIIKLKDYNETASSFWIATSPHDIAPILSAYNELQEKAISFRISLVKKLLSILKYIHAKGIVHQNLTSDSVFLDSANELYIGEFDFANHLSDSYTISHETHVSTNRIYLAPELKTSVTKRPTILSDVYSAGVLSIEILSGNVFHREITTQTHAQIEDFLASSNLLKLIGLKAWNVLLRSINNDPFKRYISIHDFSQEFSQSLRDSSIDIPFFTQKTVETKTIFSKSDSFDDYSTSFQNDLRSDSNREATSAEKNEIWNDRYEIIRIIGIGGQAVVYKAYDRLLKEEIAIKTLDNAKKDDPGALKRLLNEASAVKRLTHKHIIKTYSVEKRQTESGRSENIFICMELIDSGLDLKKVIDHRRSHGKDFSEKEVLHMASQLLDALHYAHHAHQKGGVVHRDVKPSNIMLKPNRKWIGSDDLSDLTHYDIILMDFGIAKISADKPMDVTGAGFHSAHYGSPELSDRKVIVDARADIYSAGVIMYQMLTGHIPVKGAKSVHRINKKVSSKLSFAIDRAVNSNRDQRYESASIFLKDIQRRRGGYRYISALIILAATVVLIIAVPIVDVYFGGPPSETITIKEAINILNSRTPEKVIATLYGYEIRYYDIEDYLKYDDVRNRSLDILDKQIDHAKEIEKDTQLWREQNNLWIDIEKQDRLLKNIERNYNESLQMRFEISGKITDIHYYMSLYKGAQQNILELERTITQGTLSRTFIENKNQDLINTNIILSNIHNTLKTFHADIILNDISKIQRIRAEIQPLLKTALNIQELYGFVYKDMIYEDWVMGNIAKAERFYGFGDLEQALHHYKVLKSLLIMTETISLQVSFKTENLNYKLLRIYELMLDEESSKIVVNQLMENLSNIFEIYYVSNHIAIEIEAVLDSNYILFLSSINSANASIIHLEKAIELKDSTEIDNAITEYNSFLSQNMEKLKTWVNNFSPLVSDQDIISELHININAVKAAISSESIFESRSGYFLLVERIKELSEKINTRYYSSITETINNITTAYKPENNYYNSNAISIFKHISAISMEEIEKLKHTRNATRLNTVKIKLTHLYEFLNNINIRTENLDILRMSIQEGMSFCNRFPGLDENSMHQRQQIIVRLSKLEERLSEGMIDLAEPAFKKEAEQTIIQIEDITSKLPWPQDVASAVGEMINCLLDERSRIEHLLIFWDETPCASEILSKFANYERHTTDFDEKRYIYFTEGLYSELFELYSNDFDFLVFVINKMQRLSNNFKDIIKSYEDNLHDFDLKINRLKTEIESIDFSVQILSLEDILTNLNRIESLSNDYRGFIREILAHHDTIGNKHILSEVAGVIEGFCKDTLSRIKYLSSDEILNKMMSCLSMINGSYSYKSDKDELSALKMKLSRLNSQEQKLFADMNQVSSKYIDLANRTRKYKEELLLQNFRHSIESIKLFIDGNFQNRRHDIVDVAKTIWSIYPHYHDWKEWDNFIEIFHLKTSGNSFVFRNHALLLCNVEGKLLTNDNISTANIENLFDFSAQEIRFWAWPLYARSKTDASVEFVWIPKNYGNRTPFYMAKREISNSQYLKYLNQSQLSVNFWRSESYLTIGSFISQQSPFPPSPFNKQNGRVVTRNPNEGNFIESQFDKSFAHDSPVTWVTYSGAVQYAEWLGSVLPTVKQHRAASQIDQVNLIEYGAYAHLRGLSWSKAAELHLSDNISYIEPQGALRQKQLEPSDIFFVSSGYPYAWPYAVETHPNEYYLYNIIGNVWEWCEGEMIAGGSSLVSPKDFNKNQYAHYFKSSAPDVGFRVIINLK